MTMNPVNPEVIKTLEFGRNTYGQTAEYQTGWETALTRGDHERFELPEGFSSFTPAQKHDWQMMALVNSLYPREQSRLNPELARKRAAYLTGYATAYRVQKDVEAALSRSNAEGKPLNPESVVAEVHATIDPRVDTREEILAYMHTVYGWNEQFFIEPLSPISPYARLLLDRVKTSIERIPADYRQSLLNLSKSLSPIMIWVEESPDTHVITPRPETTYTCAWCSATLTTDIWKASDMGTLFCERCWKDTESLALDLFKRLNRRFMIGTSELTDGAFWRMLDLENRPERPMLDVISAARELEKRGILTARLDKLHLTKIYTLASKQSHVEP